MNNMLSCLRTPVMGLAISLLLVDPSRATVSDIASNGFTSKIDTQIAASPDKVYATLIEPARWWSPDHTFSGDANNLHLEAKAGGCWCETLPNGGSVTHLTVVYVSPGKALRLRGALGPSQGLAVTGALTWKLEPAADGTHVSVTYALGGYHNGGFTELAKAVDGVLTAQVDRLKKVLESKAPVSH